MDDGSYEEAADASFEPYLVLSDVDVPAYAVELTDDIDQQVLVPLSGHERLEITED